MADVLPRYEAVGDTFATVNAYGVIGRILQAAGDHEAGRGYHLRELTGAIAIGDRTMVAMALSDLASLEATAGHFEIALRLQGTAQQGDRARRRQGPRRADTRRRPSLVLARAAGYDEADIETTDAGGTRPLGRGSGEGRERALSGDGRAEPLRSRRLPRTRGYGQSGPACCPPFLVTLMDLPKVFLPRLGEVERLLAAVHDEAGEADLAVLHRQGERGHAISIWTPFVEWSTPAP